MVKLLYFAILKEKIRKQEEDLDFVGSVKELRKKLTELYPQLKDVLKVCLFAVDYEYVGEDFILKGGEKVAVIPPVSGG
ncbi:molybdopterin converting factor subunit 1 [Thermocrinis sp.]|uniref:molybdopterin converting factor subunit 1 n=1 Tax=Thermocrinis sp. TaxID=2024383 RepID=UPI002FDCFDCB